MDITAAEADATATEVVVEEAPPPGQQIKDRIDAARAKMMEGQTLEDLVQAASQEEEPDAAEERATGSEAEAAAPEAEPSGEVEDGEGGSEATVDEAATEPEGAVTEEEGAEGAEEPETFAVDLPGRQPDTTETWHVNTAEEQERLQQLVNGYVRGAEVRAREAEVSEAEARLDEIVDHMATDAAGFILDQVHPDTRVEVVTSLLADPEVWAGVQEKLDDFHDPDVRTRFAEEDGRTRESNRTERQRKRDSAKANRARAREIMSGVTQLIPDGMPEDRADRFYRAAKLAIIDLVEQQRSLNVTPEQVRETLKNEGILDRFGIDGSAGSSEPAAPRPIGRAPTKGPSVDEARKTGERLQKESRQRRAAAAVAPAGAGDPAAGAQSGLPSGQSVKDRIKTARKKGLARILGGGT